MMDITKQTFDALADRWENETSHHSSFSRKRQHPAFVAMVALDVFVAAWAFERLQAGNPFWVLLLDKIIDGPTVHWEGDLLKARGAWLEWWEDKLAQARKVSEDVNKVFGEASLTSPKQ